MLTSIALVSAGFLLGVVCAACVALQVYGFLHAEAVSLLEGENGFRLHSSRSPVSPR